MIVRGIVRARLRMARNQLFPRGATVAGARRPRGWLGLALVLAFGTVVFGALSMMFSQLAANGMPADEAGGALALVFGAAVIGLLIFDLHYVVSSLLLDSDLELLRRAPLRPTALLALKIIDSLPRTSTLLLVLALPAVLAFASMYDLPGWAWFALPLQLGALWAIPLGAGTALALALVRRLPPLRARDALGLLSTLVITVLWIGNSFLLPRIAGTDGRLSAGLTAMLRPASWVAAVSPAHWAAHALVESSLGRPALALEWTGLLLLGGALSIVWAAQSAGRDLEAVLARVSVAASRGRRAPRATRARASRRPRGWITTWVMRDARLFMRDWTVLGDVLTAAALWMLLPLVGTPLLEFPPAMLARAMLLALTVGLGYEVAARSVPFERQGLAWVRLAPVSPWRWVAAKLASTGLLATGLLALAATTVALAIRLSPMQWLETTIAGLSALLLSLSLGIWTGAVFGDPAWTNPRAMMSLTGRLVASGLLVIQAAAWLGVLAWADTQRGRLTPSMFLWGPPIAALLLSLAPLAGATRWAARFEWKGSG